MYLRKRIGGFSTNRRHPVATKDTNSILNTIFEKYKAKALAVPTSESYWMIPTAEVPLTNLVRQKMLDENALPYRFAAHTPCFRAEAGAAGGHARHDPAASVLQGGAGVDHHAGADARRARAHDGVRRGSAEAPRARLSHHAAVHAATWALRAQDLRHRGVAAGAEHLSRDFVAARCAATSRRGA